MEPSSCSIPATDLLGAFKASHVDYVTTVPDLVQLALHDAVDKDPDIHLVECTTENQALTSAFGLRIGGKTPLVVMQNQGLLNCLNTLRSVSLDARMPMVLCVGQFGREFSNLGQDPNDSARHCVNKVEPVLDALEIPYWRLETASDVEHVMTAFKTAADNQCATVLLVGHYLAWR